MTIIRFINSAACTSPSPLIHSNDRVAVRIILVNQYNVSQDPRFDDLNATYGESDCTVAIGATGSSGTSTSGQGTDITPKVSVTKCPTVGSIVNTVREASGTKNCDGLIGSRTFNYTGGQLDAIPQQRDEAFASPGPCDQTAKYNLTLRTFSVSSPGYRAQYALRPPESQEARDADQQREHQKVHPGVGL